MTKNKRQKRALRLRKETLAQKKTEQIGFTPFTKSWDRDSKEGKRGFDHEIELKYQYINHRLLQEATPTTEEKTRGRVFDGYKKLDRLWVGRDHLLDEYEVKQLIKLLRYWMKHKRLPESLL